MINTISYFGLKIVFFGFLPDDFSKLYCINPILVDIACILRCLDVVYWPRTSKSRFRSVSLATIGIAVT